MGLTLENASLCMFCSFLLRLSPRDGVGGFSRGGAGIKPTKKKCAHCLPLFLFYFSSVDMCNVDAQ